MKTPGGHRKFKIKDVLAFVNEDGFEALGVNPEATEEESGNVFPMLVLKHDLPGLARFYLESATHYETRESAQVLFRLLAAGFPLSEICDGVIAPALEEVGAEWCEGHSKIIEEHLVSATTIHALNRMTEMIPRQTPNGRKALCCPAEDDAHTIGVDMTRLLLDSLGWQTQVIVSPLPFAELVEYLKRENPDLLCISVVNKPLDETLQAELERICSAAQETGTQVAIGGRGISGLTDLPHDFLGGSIRDLEVYARNVSSRKRPMEERTNGRHS